MVEAAIEGNPGFEISRIELDRGGPSYTVDTLAALHGVEPGVRLALILSAESFVGLPSWNEAERILTLADVIVAPRFGYDAVDGSFIAQHFPASKAQAVFLDGPRVWLSASEIRQRAAAGRSVRYLVPDAVAAYIGDHGLYQDKRRTDRS